MDKKKEAEVEFDVDNDEVFVEQVIKWRDSKGKFAKAPKEEE